MPEKKKQYRRCKYDYSQNLANLGGLTPAITLVKEVFVFFTFLW